MELDYLINGNRPLIGYKRLMLSYAETRLYGYRNCFVVQPAGSR